MLTLENAKLYLEHAPAPKPHEGDILGWRITSDLNTICDDCASRIIGRGCDFTGVVPIYRTNGVLSLPCDACGQLLGDVGAPAKRPPFYSIITLAADSYAELRRCDVYRVLDAANNVDSLLEFGATLIAQRPDLRGEVEACIEELATPAFTLRNDPPKHTPARFQSQDKTRQRVLVEGMDCLPGQQDLF